MQIALSILVPLAYLLVHESIHFTVARLLGLSASIRLSSDGALPSISVNIAENVDRSSRYLVLYSPYIVNLVMLFTSNCFIKAFSLLTFVNALLEEENQRRLRLIIALGIFMILFMLLEKYSSRCYSWP